MFHIPAQVPDCGIRNFPEIPVGMMHIPQGGEFVAGVAVHQRAQTGCISINADGLDQQADVFFLREGKQGFNILPDLFLIVPQGTERDIPCFQGGSGFDQILRLFRRIKGQGKINGRIQAGKDKPVFLQFTNRFIQAVAVESSSAA